MSELSTNYKIIEFGPCYLLGKKTIVQKGKTAIKFVKEFRNDGSNDFLQNLDNRISPFGDLIIWMGDYDPITKSFIEIPGVFINKKCDINQEYVIKELPQCKMAILTVSASNRDITRGAHNKLVKLIEKEGYVPDYSFGYSMEYYSYEKYEKENDVYEFSYYLPCKLPELKI